MGDGGAGHAIGQGAAQAPIGADGGSTMSGGQSFAPSSGQSFGPAHTYGPGAPGQGVYPDPTGSSAGAPFASDGGASGQGYFGPGAGQGAAGPGYTPTSSVPNPSLTTPSGTPFGTPGAPHFERTRWNLFGRSRKDTQDEENYRLATQAQMTQIPMPSTSFPHQPAFIVDNSRPPMPPMPSSTQMGVPLQTSIEYTGAQPKFPSGDGRAS